jgi:hypothetical protein
MAECAHSAITLSPQRQKKNRKRETYAERNESEIRKNGNKTQKE